jgi:hypothetical protein
MNIYQKLNEVRVELQGLKLKKSGRNDYSKYDYYELGDFLPAVNLLCKKYGIVTTLNILPLSDSEVAILKLINAEEPSEVVEISSPTAEAHIGAKWKEGVQVGGADPIQNLGGKITYMRRYLLMTAFEMVESDVVDQTQRDLTESMAEEDVQKILKAKDEKELLEVCGGFNNKYRKSLIVPHYQKRLEELKQESEENKDQSKEAKAKGKKE